MSVANNNTQSRVWHCLFDHGPATPRAIRPYVKRTSAAIYEALKRLTAKGKVRRTGGGSWNYIYEVEPGATPPENGRGLHPNSRKALAEASAAHGRGVLKQGTQFQPCALAECWGLSNISRANND